VGSNSGLGSAAKSFGQRLVRSISANKIEGWQRRYVVLDEQQQSLVYGVVHMEGAHNQSWELKVICYDDDFARSLCVLTTTTRLPSNHIADRRTRVGRHLPRWRLRAAGAAVQAIGSACLSAHSPAHRPQNQGHRVQLRGADVLHAIVKISSSTSTLHSIYMLDDERHEGMGVGARASGRDAGRSASWRAFFAAVWCRYTHAATTTTRRLIVLFLIRQTHRVGHAAQARRRLVVVRIPIEAMHRVACFLLVCLLIVPPIDFALSKATG
jgi:hypothetical protein